MTIKLQDGSVPSAIKFGSSTILKVYKGTALLWTRTPTFTAATRYNTNSIISTDSFVDHEWNTLYGLQDWVVAKSGSNPATMTFTFATSAGAADWMTALASNSSVDFTLDTADISGSGPINTPRNKDNFTHASGATTVSGVAGTGPVTPGDDVLDLCEVNLFSSASLPVAFTTEFTFA